MPYGSASLMDEIVDHDMMDRPVARDAAASLRALIDTAFANVETDGGLLDSENSEAAEAAPAAQRHWSGYTASELEHCTGTLCELSVTSWRFHLPAFMHAALERLSLPVWETALPGAVLFNLTHAADDPVRSARLLARFRSLSAAQERAVRAFLDHVSQCPHQEPVRVDDARKALRSYWDLPELARPRVARRTAARAASSIADAAPKGIPQRRQPPGFEPFTLTGSARAGRSLARS